MNFEQTLRFLEYFYFSRHDVGSLESIHVHQYVECAVQIKCGKAFLLSNSKHHFNQVHSKNRGKTTCILNLHTRWRWMASFSTGGTEAELLRSCSRHRAYTTKILSLPGTELRTFNIKQITLPTNKPRYSGWGKRRWVNLGTFEGKTEKPHPCQELKSGYSPRKLLIYQPRNPVSTNVFLLESLSIIRTRV
jgi:hypothetical protein